MSALGLIVTDVGRAALIDAANGATLAVRITEVGVTATDFVLAPTLTTLPGELKRLDAVAGVAIDATTIHLTIRDDSADVYNLRGLGIYLDDGTLFAVCNPEVTIIGKAEVSSLQLAADIRLIAGDAGLITFGDANFINPPASETVKGVAYLATLAEALAGAVADKTMTPATLAAVLASYVKGTQLAQPNGVATLGADGKLAAAQRPSVDIVDVFPAASQAAMLALPATVGDFAVRSDNARVYILQATPATTLANWLEVNTPSPVQSVNGKVGAVVLAPADIGAVPPTRQITGLGLASGGGALDADRAITVSPASQAETDAGQIANKAVTPAALAGILQRLGASVPGGRRIDGAGLVTGGGDLLANRELRVDAATVAQIVAGIAANVAITPQALANLPQSLTPNGYFTLPGGLIVQWVQYRAAFTSEVAVPIAYPTAFTQAVFYAGVTGYLSVASRFRDLFPQIVEPGLASCFVQLQADDSTDMRLDGFNVLLIGK